MNDEKLVTMLLEGDGEAFSVLVKRYKYAVYGICLSMIGDFDQAEDLAQEAFIKAYGHIRKLGAPERFGNWLKVIAVNECRLYRRRRRPIHVPLEQIRESEISKPDHLLPPDRQRDVHEERVERERLETAALESLGRLPEDARHALALYYLGENTISDVAEFLGISKAATKMRLHRARKQLRKEALEMVQSTLEHRELGPEFENRIQPIEATVLFADVAGFSRIVGILSAEELVALLNEYLSDMADIVLRHEGTLDRFEGDAIVAFWGAPTPCADHARKACLAALDMQRRLEEWQREGKPELNVRCGLNTGHILAGDMGSRQLRSYTTLGDQVNLASRLEGTGKHLGTRILISENTYLAARTVIEAREVDKIRWKDPVIIYELLGRRNELNEATSAMIERYRRGHDHYKAREWQLALDHFDEALRIDPEDGPSRVYRDRCRFILDDPPDELTESWDGVFEWSLGGRAVTPDLDLARLRRQCSKLVSTSSDSPDPKANVPAAMNIALAPAVEGKIRKNPDLLKLSGSEMDITVLVSDISQFSSIFEQLTAEDVVSLLSEYHSEMTEAVLAHEGTLDKYEGDALVAFWGAPVPEPDHAIRSCLAVLEMEVKLDALRSKLRDEGRPEVHAKYGLNSGRAIVGNLGSRQRADYTAMGFHVSLASYLEKANKTYGTRILISEYTQSAVRDTIETREVDTLAFRIPQTQKNPVTVYEVLSRKGQLNRAKARVVETYTEALDHYRRRDLERALECLSETLVLDPEDGPSQALSTRCEAMLIEKPHWFTDQWNGAFRL